MHRFCKFVTPLCAVLLLTSLACAGGVDPRDMPPAETVQREKVTATPAQTSAAVSKARTAVAPNVPQERVSAPAPRAVQVSRDAWQLSAREGGCAPLDSLARKVNIGSFKTPQEFARQMQQRGYQAFVLDIGDTKDQVVRVKVPDRELDLTFVRAGMCR